MYQIGSCDLLGDMSRHFPQRDADDTKPGDRIRWGAGVAVVALICLILANSTGEDLAPFFSDLALILGVVGLGAVALGLFGK